MHIRKCDWTRYPEHPLYSTYMFKALEFFISSRIFDQSPERKTSTSTEALIYFFFFWIIIYFCQIFRFFFRIVYFSFSYIKSYIYLSLSYLLLSHIVLPVTHQRIIFITSGCLSQQIRFYSNKYRRKKIKKKSWRWIEKRESKGKCLKELSNLPFLRRSTEMGWPSSLLHMILGVGKPSALHVRLMFWFSRIAIVDCVLSVSMMLGGTAKRNKKLVSNSSYSVVCEIVSRKPENSVFPRNAAFALPLQYVCSKIDY